jgi:MoaA/NifB/PqqE/SkfB family radical SAM enzyme
MDIVARHFTDARSVCGGSSSYAALIAMTSADLLSAYNASRARATDKSVLCHAPFVSLNFDQSGNVTACCFNRHYVLGTYPAQSLHEIWTGAPARALREAFLTNSYAPGCDRCFDQLKSRNFAGTLMRNFDPYGTRRPTQSVDGADMPLVLEFEIANTCTLECVMCGGHWSSAIRERREKLPPLRNPYDRAFVEQLEEFLPSVAAARFLGGEPFLINRYHEIWDSLCRLNPDALITITTSAATLPDRSRAVLERLRAVINVSLDSLTPAVYESIRVNARFDQVMENVNYFLDYTRRRGTSVTLAVCPMTHNWRELRDIVEFAEARKASVFFNTVTFPIESSLASLPEAALGDVIAHLEAGGPAAIRMWTRSNREQWESLVNQLKGWREEKRAFARHCAEVAVKARSFAAVHLAGIDLATLQAIERSIAPLVLAHEVAAEHALALRGRGTLDGTLLPQPPLALWPGDEAPEADVLLLAAHVVSRFAPARGEAGGSDVVDEHRRLRMSFERTRQSPDGRSRLDRLGTKVIERLRQADVQSACDVITMLLDSLDPRHLLLLAEPGELRGRVDQSWERSGAHRLNEDERARVTRYFDRLVAFHSLTRFLDGLDAAASVDRQVVRHIGDERDLHAALHAIHIFHLAFAHLDKHEPFRRRLETIRGALTPERTPRVLASLQQAEVTHVYTFLATASDEQFAAAIGAA